LSTILGWFLSGIHFYAEINMKIVMNTCSKNHVTACGSMARSPVLPGSPRWARCAGMKRGLEIVGTRARSECRRQSKTGTSASPMRGVVHGPSGSGGDPGWEECARIGDAAGEVQPRQFVACQKQRQEGVGTLFAEPDLKTAKSEGPTASELGAEPPEPPSRTATRRSPAIGVWRCRAHILTAPIPPKTITTSDATTVQFVARAAAVATCPSVSIAREQSWTSARNGHGEIHSSRGSDGRVKT